MPAIFNKEQEEAITHKEGPLMVLAGPGSGKTLVITYRVKWLIENAGVHPSNILVITFTRAAAEEMRKRFFAFDGMENAPVTFGTFHSIFFMILRYAYRYTAGNIIREDVKRRYIKEMTENMELEIEDEKEFLSGIINEISYVKGEMMSLSYYHSSNCSDELFAQIYEGYERRLREENLIDFDDMLVFCYELLKERKDILAMWQQKFQYILIDEFQDINKVQYEIVRMLAGKGDHLFIVGDDDQSIYRFRGARPELMLHFKDDYPEAEQILLDTNYRSQKEIVEASLRLIGCNKERFQKKIQANQEAGEPVEYAVFKSQREEIAKIIWDIQAHMDRGGRYEDFAILFRTNTQARAISAKLKEYNIPFVMKEMVPNLYDHWIMRDILTYIKVACGNRERGNVMRIINRPKRYVHRNALTDAYIDLEELELFYEDKDWMVDRIVNLRADLGLIADMRPYAAVNFIRRGVGYDDYIQEYAEYRGIRAGDMYEILDELQEASKGFKDFEEWFAYIESYGEELKKQSEKSRQRDNGQPEDAVLLMTMHGAKGLEFECVFIPDVNEGVTPYSKAVLTEDIEEERRMFYVAITRAKSHLHIYYLKERFSKEVSVSRFVGEMLGAEDAESSRISLSRKR